MDVVGLVAGVALVVTAWSSLLGTFVLPRGRSFFQRPPTLAQRGVYYLACQLSRLRRSYAAKDELLATVGPIALIVQLAMFLGMFLLGYALVLQHWSHDFPLAVDQGAAGLFTVGLAHVAGPTSNAAVVLAAATGAVSVALQIGYLPAIYQSYARRESLVALMESRAGVPAWGPEVLIRHQLVASAEALADFYAEWELWSADLAESHSSYPVLLLFRSPVPGYSWMLSLLAVLDAAAMQLALCPTTAPVQARMCLRMGFSALRRLAWVLDWPYSKDPLPGDPIDLSEEEFALAVRQLNDADFPTERDAADAWPHFHGWRVNYEAVAYRLADYLCAPHAPWSGTRRFLPPDVVLPDRPPHRSPEGDERRDDRFRIDAIEAARARTARSGRGPVR